jgi:hypothetical protein
MYHYFAAAEIYNAIRIFIAAYVWMTGFGNFSYYYIRKDFSLARFSQVISLILYTLYYFIIACYMPCFFLSFLLVYISYKNDFKCMLLGADDVAAQFLCGILLYYP